MDLLDVCAAVYFGVGGSLFLFIGMASLMLDRIHAPTFLTLGIGFILMSRIAAKGWYYRLVDINEPRIQVKDEA